MAKVNLDGKKVPLSGIETRHLAYQVLDKEGYESVKDFYFRYYLDKQGHVYVLPLKDVKLTPEGKITNAQLAYTVEDVIAAASGDVEKQNKINSYIAQLREEYSDNTFMNKTWQTELFEDAREDFIDYVNNTRVNKKGLPPLNPSEVPTTPTTYEDLTPTEVSSLAATARDSQTKSSPKVQ